ncbi:glycine zipper 2TM domain-containing protein [Pseudomonas borbori]|uniref:Glycine zipper 2TM domain-containing protein n=1 Tax=Pseudomonas borbori TaxID=289003 RepID=A0A1I5U900_9PSED|nr:glycine zipper 2TM domain-containing protein [Pseudomonas borbori]SFP91722.1 Glycine zipper 2TM domain-containing protein [Pseudomonas borbori]
MRMLKKTGPLVLGACIGLSAGCANMSQNEWMNKENIGTLAGAAAGVLIGSQVSSGSGRTAAMMVGALAGGMLGKSIGAKLDERDRQALALQTQQVLNNSLDGQASTWTFGHSGASAQITPVSTEIRSRTVAVKRTAQVQPVPNMQLLNKPYRALKSANVRSAPSTSAEKVGGLASGSTDNNWIMVGRQGVSIGYVYAPLVAAVGSQTTASTAQPVAPATDLDAMDVASAKEQGFDLDSLSLVEEQVTAQTTCRTVNYNMTSKGANDQQTVQACQAADGAWELI